MKNQNHMVFHEDRRLFWSKSANTLTLNTNYENVVCLSPFLKCRIFEGKYRYIFRNTDSYKTFNLGTLVGQKFSAA